MKCSIVFLCISAAMLQTVFAFDKEVFVKMGQKCKDEVNPSDEDMSKLMEKQIPTTKPGKCMMACIFKAMGVMTSDGKFDEEGNIKAAEKAFKDDQAKIKKAKDFTDACKDKINAAQDDGDGCERAAVMFSCAMELGYDKDE